MFGLLLPSLLPFLVYSSVTLTPDGHGCCRQVTVQVGKPFGHFCLCRQLYLAFYHLFLGRYRSLCRTQWNLRLERRSNGRIAAGVCGRMYIQARFDWLFIVNNILHFETIQFGLRTNIVFNSYCRSFKLSKATWWPGGWRILLPWGIILSNRGCN